MKEIKFSNVEELSSVSLLPKRLQQMGLSRVAATELKIYIYLTQNDHFFFLNQFCIIRSSL